MRPTIGAVVLSMGTRPAELAHALRSLLAQRDVDLDLLVVGNGWRPEGLPAEVRSLALPENVGIPEGRNVGARAVSGDLLFFLGDDAALVAEDALVRLATVLGGDPGAAIAQPRAVDPTGRPAPSRWVPRPGGRGAQRPGVVVGVWEDAFAVRRKAFDEVGGFPGSFFYAHEGIDLVWRLWDAGWVCRYVPDVVVHHPATSPTRHATYYRLSARNRVWLARRNLPRALAVVYVAVWTVATVVRVRRPGPLRVVLAGTVEGMRTDPGRRRPMRWSTVWRMTRAGRPPVL